VLFGFEHVASLSSGVTLNGLHQMLISNIAAILLPYRRVLPITRIPFHANVHRPCAI